MKKKIEREESSHAKDRHFCSSHVCGREVEKLFLSLVLVDFMDRASISCSSVSAHDEATSSSSLSAPAGVLKEMQRRDQGWNGLFRNSEKEQSEIRD